MNDKFEPVGYASYDGYVEPVYNKQDELKVRRHNTWRNGVSMEIYSREQVKAMLKEMAFDCIREYSNESENGAKTLAIMTTASYMKSRCGGKGQ